MRLPLIIAITGLIGCAEFPQIDGTLDLAARSAAYPTLQPLDPLLAQAQSLHTTDQITPALNTRTAQLMARATRLRGPVIDANTRAKMQRGVAVPAAIR